MSIEAGWRSAAAAVTACALAGAAQAHVTADPAEAPAGASVVVRFQVGHGCQGAPTTGLRIEMPPGVKSARPQAKAGWSIRVEPDGEGGVAAVSWTGMLAADQFDDFTLMIRMPSGPGSVYFPAVQTCGANDEQWTQIPDPGEAAQGLKHPAPSIRISPASTPDNGHHHEGH